MLVDIFNKVTALVCAMQAPYLNIVNINFKLEKPSHPGPDRSAGAVAWRTGESNVSILWEMYLGKNTFQNFFYFDFRGTRVILKFEIGGGNRVNQ